MTTNESEIGTTGGPVLFAYDGSELAQHSITEAARHLEKGRSSLVVCVWQPADVGFSPINKQHFDADEALAVHRAAEETAAHGASLTEAAGFPSRSLAIEASPTWKGIVQVAKDNEASLIVIGSHRHGGIIGHLVGSVAAAVVAHSSCPVLLVHHN